MINDKWLNWRSLKKYFGCTKILSSFNNYFGCTKIQSSFLIISVSQRSYLLFINISVCTKILAFVIKFFGCTQRYYFLLINISVAHKEDTNVEEAAVDPCWSVPEDAPQGDVLPVGGSRRAAFAVLIGHSHSASYLGRPWDPAINEKWNILITQWSSLHTIQSLRKR